MSRLLFVLLFVTAVGQAAQRIDPAVLQALQTAQAAQSKGDHAAARRALAQVKAPDSSLEAALLARSLGYLAWAEGDRRKALAELEKALGSGLLGAEEQANEKLNIARLSLAEGRYLRVVELLAPLPAAAPEEQLKMLVQAYQGLGQHERALPLAERYVKANPRAEDAWLQLLVAGNAQLKRYAEAERWQRALLARHSERAQAWWQLAGLQQMAGQEQRALATLRAARAKGLAFSERELDNLVLIAAAAGQPWQGARMLEALLAERQLPSNAARQERLGQLWWQARERGQAASVYRQLARQTGQANHWMALAQLELEQENWQAGLEALQLAERAGADRRKVRDWREWAQGQLEQLRGPQVAQLR